MKVETGSAIIVPELEKISEKNSKMGDAMKKVDRILMAYAHKVSWDDIQMYCNNEFGLNKTSDSYRHRYRRIRNMAKGKTE